MAIRIKELRMQHKYSCKQLAEMLNMSESVYKNYECNPEQSTDLDRLIRLSKLYGVTLDYILGLSNKPHK